MSLSTTFQGRVLLLNYDQFCREPRKELETLLNFIETEISHTDKESLLVLVERPNSVGRYLEHGLKIFDPADVDFVEDLGFEVIRNGETPRPPVRVETSGPPQR